MKKYLMALCLCACFFCLSACISNDMTLHPSFWNDHQKVMVVAMNADSPTLFKESGGWESRYFARDFSIPPLVQKLNQYPSSRPLQIKTIFIRKLQQQGVIAFDYKNQIDRYRIFIRQDRSQEIFPKLKNFSAAHGYSARYLLFISVDKLGAVRSKSRWATLSAPYGEKPSAVCVVNAKLFDMDTNREIWINYIDTRVDIEEPWNQPPNYPNLIKALNSAVDQTRIKLINRFFGS